MKNSALKLEHNAIKQFGHLETKYFKRKWDIT